MESEGATSNDTDVDMVLDAAVGSNNDVEHKQGPSAVKGGSRNVVVSDHDYASEPTATTPATATAHKETVSEEENKDLNEEEDDEILTISLPVPMKTVGQQGEGDNATRDVLVDGHGAVGDKGNKGGVLIDGHGSVGDKAKGDVLVDGHGAVGDKGDVLVDGHVAVGDKEENKGGQVGDDDEANSRQEEESKSGVQSEQEGASETIDEPKCKKTAEDVDDKDTVSTATADEVVDGIIEMDNAEEDDENPDSFLTIENINKITNLSESDGESDTMDSEVPSSGKRVRKAKNFGATFITDDDAEWKETKSLSTPRRTTLKNDNLNLDMLRVPFDYGWRREIVERNQREGSNTSKDTYYHTPDGSKLRSMVQIADYLEKTNSPLSTDNFSFARKSLFEPPYEIMRKANTGRNYFAKTGMTTIVGKRGRPGRRGRGRGRGRPRVAARHTQREDSNSSPEKSSTILIPLTLRNPTTPAKRRRGRPSIQPYPRPQVVIERDDDDEDEEEEEEEDDADSSLNLSPTVAFGSVPMKRSHSDVESDTNDSGHKPVTEPVRKKATARKSTTPRLAICKPLSKIIPPPSQIGPLGQLCTLQCPGLEGQPPTLQCSGCMCLFHPGCVNYKGVASSTFMCLICAQESSLKHVSTVAQSVASRPAMLISSKSGTLSSASSSLISIAQTFNSSPNAVVVQPKTTVINPTLSCMSGISPTITTINATADTIGALRSILDKRQPNIPNFSSLSITTSSAISNPPNLCGLLSTSVGTLPVTSVAPVTGLPLLPVVSSIAGFPNIINSSGLLPLSLSSNQVNAASINTTLSTAAIRSAPPLTLPRPPPPILAKPTQLPSIPPPRLTVAPGMLIPVCQANVQTHNDHQASPNTSKRPDIPLNAQLLTLPEAVTKRLKLSQPLALKINNIQIVVPPSCVINSSDGLKVLLPPNTFPLPTDPNAKLSVTVSNNTSGLETADATMGGVTMATDVTNGELTPQRKMEDGVAFQPTRAGRRRQAMHNAACYIKKLYGGYDCMLAIFGHLRAKELLRAGMVCRTWNKIATQHCLWKWVSLRGTCVSDWDSAARFFRRVRTEALCLQGMYHKQDRNRTWHLMTANLHQLVGLREIEFGHVPSSVLHLVCETLVNLEVFKAEYIWELQTEQQSRNVPCKIDLGKFASLKHLRELRLRGTGGLTLPSFSLSGGLSELALLDNLQILSLTTLKSIPDQEYHFLRDMKKLTMLEIGSCNAWSSETYFVLGTLTNLTHLRLEYGGEMPDIGLGDALSNLTRLEVLQMIHFALADTLYLSLEHLTGLRSLVVWPESADMAAVNANTLTLVSKLQKLEVLEWGVIMNPDPASDPPPDHDRQAMWIPFYPPNYQELLQEAAACPVPINKLSLIQLTESLANCLPNTDIKVKKIKSQPKVNGWENDS